MSLPAITELIPHRGRAVLLDRAVEHDASSIRCTATLRDDFPYMVEGRVPAVVGVELMAQAVAAYVGMTGYEAGRPPRRGYLVGVRGMQLYVPDYIAGDALDVTATLEWSSGRAGTFTAAIDRAGNRLAEATLTVYQPPAEEVTEA